LFSDTFPTTTFDSSKWSSSADATIGDGGVGASYRIQPNQVFDAPQRIWLPIPDGVDAAALTLMYCKGNERTRVGIWRRPLLASSMICDLFVT